MNGQAPEVSGTSEFRFLAPQQSVLSRGPSCHSLSSQAQNLARAPSTQSLFREPLPPSILPLPHVSAVYRTIPGQPRKDTPALQRRGTVSQGKFSQSQLMTKSINDKVLP